MQYSSMLPKAGNRCISEDKTIKKKREVVARAPYLPQWLTYLLEMSLSLSLRNRPTEAMLNRIDNVCFGQSEFF